MSKKRGRPPLAEDKTKSAYLEVRLEEAEKIAFKDAANLAGQALSVWIRDRLRATARKELEGAGLPVAFLPKQKRGT
jgi:hypothetical protein